MQNVKAPNECSEEKSNLCETKNSNVIFHPNRLLTLLLSVQTQEIRIYRLFSGSEEIYNENNNECSSEIACPAGCTCDGSVVDCSGLHLTEIPKDIPIQTTEL